MNAFAAMLGLHAGITYANSRTAIATSIGTLLFLFLGVATCMRIMLAFSNSFDYQFTTFLGFIAGGSLGAVRGARIGEIRHSTPLAGRRWLTPFADVRRHHQLLAGQLRHGLPGDGVHLRLRDVRDAGAGDLRVRRRHRAARPRAKNEE